MIAIIQPFISHYRADFFNKLNNIKRLEVFIYEDKLNIEKRGFNIGDYPTNKLSAVKVGKFLFYNPFVFFRKKYTTLILMGSVQHLTTWVILLCNIFLKKKIILWGHGISIKKYDKEVIKQPLSRRCMYRLANFAWFYTQNELKSWLEIFPKLNAVALNNTISDVDRILKKPLPNFELKDTLKHKYNIYTEINMIICVRFSNPNRKAELLIDLFKILDSQKFGLLVIGDGSLKPDFSSFNNIYDFGAIYDPIIKEELFSIADIYIQPAWIGLSGVEALAHGLPVFTLRRSKNIFQCVEYNYLIDGENSIITNTVQELAEAINNINWCNLEKLKLNAKAYAKTNLSMNDMILKAKELL
ncbi:MAG: glycosyltransferase [Arcobacter sp.]|nr:glycosyltransferase [Arcobacter sp.]